MKKIKPFLTLMTIWFMHSHANAQHDYHEFNSSGESKIVFGTFIVKIPAVSYVFVGESRTSSNSKHIILVRGHDFCMEVMKTIFH